MATSHVQKKCEKWIIDHWLPERFNEGFGNKQLKMQGRGKFEFDAVNESGTIVGNISTATAYTYRGDIASGKKSKIRADCLMLSLVSAKKKLMILTEPCMHEFTLKEQEAGRLPLDIEVCHADLPSELKEALAAAREEASKEVRGGAL
ncbi:hypothetical protein [Syntrophus aciditrophicus]|uniref:Hypothetical cytosolic protein n=1 Tax=Syntrophus aciditrophicus (strain SB) TaxID=56780 RepID=Q2LV17_SYNAS|nr:hypothetical protein [Syntrophus aciditrophicus]ABC77926.1 hypothetical cytosolic protein [Syntrophus aciditrophicus SB]